MTTRGTSIYSHVYEAPAELDPDDHRLRVFLAGGITGCPDWQAAIVPLLWDLPLAIFNPRRAVWNAESEDQIQWEHKYLLKAHVALFWFCAATVCPIALYELGVVSAWRGLTGHKALFVGIEPGYAREVDVRIQTRLERPEVEIADSLEDLARQVRDYAR